MRKGLASRGAHAAHGFGSMRMSTAAKGCTRASGAPVSNRRARSVLQLGTLLDARHTFDAVSKMHRNGIITRETWHAYCYAWRDTFRYSSVGKQDAAEHARRVNVPLPYSDR